MDNTKLFFSLKGRIRRRLWWLGSLGLGVVTLGLVVVSALFGFGPWGFFRDLGTLEFGSFFERAKAIGWYNLALTAILAYPASALAIKRRQDRGDNGLDVKIFTALTLLMSFWTATQLGFDIQEIQFPRGGPTVSVPVPPTVYSAFNALLGLFGLYLFVMLGFIAGTKGPNAYGDDPVPPKPGS